MMKSVDSLTKEVFWLCANCGSKRLKTVDLGGYAYGIFETTCEDCNFKETWMGD